MSSDTGDHDGNSSNRLHGIVSTTPDSEHGLKADAGRQQEETKVVLIWDVDETLVLFLSLLDGSFARAFQQVLFLPSLLAQNHGLRCHAQYFIASQHLIFLGCAMNACDINTRGQAHRQASCWSTFERLPFMAAVWAALWSGPTCVPPTQWGTLVYLGHP